MSVPWMLSRFVLCMVVVSRLIAGLLAAGRDALCVCLQRIERIVAWVGS
jgi:hypothetical protein